MVLEYVVIADSGIGTVGTTWRWINEPLKLKEGTDGTFNNVVLGVEYDAINCDETRTAYAGGSGHWSVIEYGCTAVDGDPASWDLPTFSNDATGFTGYSFWSALACD